MLRIDIIQHTANFFHFHILWRGQSMIWYEFTENVLQMSEEYTAVILLCKVYLDL